MGNAKIVFGDKVLIDLTSDTAKADKLLEGYTTHDSNGDPIVGTCTYDADTSDATMTEDELLLGVSGYKNGKKVIGKMPNNGAVSGKISTKDQEFSVSYGFHDGSGKVGIADTEKEKLKPENIRQGVSILGVEGSMSGSEGVKAQSKSVTPTVAGFDVLPDSGYTHLTQVTVAPIPYVETENASGGKTVKIG